MTLRIAGRQMGAGRSCGPRALLPWPNYYVTNWYSHQSLAGQKMPYRCRAALRQRLLAVRSSVT